MTETSTKEPKRSSLKAKSESNLGDIRSIWPKIVEYTGLSEYESKVYLSLLSLGNAGARKLSLHCDVPRTKVYGTLKKLIDYGLVVEIPGSPKQFAPSNPNEAFNTILNLTKKKAMDFETVVQTLIKTHEKNKEETGPQKKLIWYLNENDEIKGKCSEIIRQSEEELIILTSEDRLGVLFNSAHRLLDEVARALDSILGGGLRRGDTVLIDFGEDMPSLILGLLVGTMRANFITGGSGVLMIPPGGESVDRITRFDERLGLSDEERGRLLRIALMRSEENPPRYLIGLDPSDIKRSLRTWGDEKAGLLSSNGKPVLKIVHINKAYSLWPVEHTKLAIDTESMATKDEGGLLVLLTRPGSEDLARHSSNIAGAHLALTNEQGVILFRGIRPRTQLYALEMNRDGGYPRLRFTPIR